MPHGCSFSAAEIDDLLDIIEDVLPIGPDDLDTVTEHHITYYPGLGQTCKSLRQK